MHSDLALVDRAVAAVKAGDTSALHFLYVRYADEMVAYTRSIVRDGHDAEDIVHGIFVQLPWKLRNYELRGLPFERWLTRVARNAALDHLRSRRHVPVPEVHGPAEATPEDRSIEARRVLCEALELLPSDQRDVIVLRHMAGLSPAEIAATLDRSESSVHGLHHRGRKALRTVLEESGERPAVLSAAG